MRGEIYVDLLYLELFSWNACTLWLTNRLTWNVAGKLRLLVGAALGAGLWTLVLTWPIQFFVKVIFSLGILIGMLSITFLKGGLTGILRVFEYYWICSLTWGGAAVLVIRLMAFLTGGRWQMPITVMTEMGLMPLAVRWMRHVEGKRNREGKAVLVNGDHILSARAIIDTGNSLIEPISGRPVCVLDGNCARQLWGEGEAFRVVPWHGVGVEKGILKAYRLPQAYLSLGGPVKIMREAYVAVKEEGEEGDGETSALLIIHPKALEENLSGKGNWRKGSKNVIMQLKLPGNLRFRWRRLEREKSPAQGGDLYYIGGSDVLPPPLEPGTENQMIIDLETDRKEEAKATLIEHNLRLVVYIAKKFDNTGVGVEDLISIGTIGLIKSINTFQPGKNIKLATYASRCIENEMLMYLRRNNKTKLEVSFDEPLNVDWDGNELLLSDILGTDEDVIYRDIENQVERGLLKKALAKLGDREKLIISLRFGLGSRDGSEMTQKEVAQLLGISQSYISRLEKKIMRQLKKEMSLQQ